MVQRRSKGQLQAWWYFSVDSETGKGHIFKSRGTLNARWRWGSSKKCCRSSGSKCDVSCGVFESWYVVFMILSVYSNHISYNTQITRISLVSLIHIIRKSLEYQRSNLFTLECYESWARASLSNTGTRYVMSMWFTCDESRRFENFLDGQVHQTYGNDDGAEL